jgi:hypothetical protein
MTKTTNLPSARVCKRCRGALDNDWFGLCQMCWEGECSESWWEMWRWRPTSRMRADGVMELAPETRQWIAAFLEAAGVRPKHCMGIDDSLTAGYGRLDEFGFWEYPLCRTR